MLLGFRFCKLGGRRERVACIHDRGTCAHVDRHPERLENFLSRSVAIDSGFGVKGDAVVAADGDRNRERDQLLGFGVKRAWRERRLGDGGKALSSRRPRRCEAGAVRC